MGGECSSSTVESGLDLLPTGSENELLRIRGAQLCLIDGEESVVIQNGDFAFHVIKQTGSPLAAAVALVGDFQWPVGKDSPALNVGNCRYTFGLPGLMYGLVLPSETPTEAVQSLEGLLRQYSMYRGHLDISAEDRQAWCHVAPRVENLSGIQMARQYEATCEYWASMEPSGSEHDSSPRMANRILQARRMSAVAKLLCKTLVRGAINAKAHVAGDSVFFPSAPSSQDRDVALARVDAFAKVAAAVETGGRSLLVAEQTEETDTATWTLNKVGLRLLLQATAASAAIHVARGLGPPSVSSSSPTSVLSHHPQSQGHVTNSHEVKMQRQYVANRDDDEDNDEVDRGIYGPSTRHFISSPQPPLFASAGRSHGSNSPFQQYSRPMETRLQSESQSPSHFHFNAFDHHRQHM